MKRKEKKLVSFQKEEEILKFWNENKIFEKSLKKKSKKGDFVFYDGPPFATGLPHYGHILASVIKDAVPRYKTMQGYHVPRKWGWDCHGLPVENLIEKDLGLKTKKDIEDYGIGKFNKSAKNSVFKYRDQWKKIIPRIGRWVDMEDDYRTLDTDYVESVFWVFSELYKKDFVYKGHKSMHICPRCETTLANFEVNQGYKDITDISVTAKFELEEDPNTYVLAWTTTPWTLPGNVALAVGKNIDYVKIKVDSSMAGSEYKKNGEVIKKINFKKGDEYIIAKEIFWNNMISNGSFSDIRGMFSGYLEMKNDILKNISCDDFLKKHNIPVFKGKDLIGKKYKPVFDYYQKNKDLENRENGWKIYGADFVTTEDGTGVVHIAPAFGEDDMRLGKENNLPFVQHVSMDGRFKKEVKDFAGLSVKAKDEHQSTDIEIIKWLAHNGKLFAKEKLVHSYPHCWRCDTPLLNYASSSWFVEVEKLKAKLLKNNKKVNWIPEHIKDGRFGKWLHGARDWAVSRSRFWGAPLPVWECKECKSFEVLGSLSDIKKRSGFSNKYFVMRHGEAEYNTKKLVASENIKSNKLTKKGVSEVEKSSKKLKNIDIIIASPFLRTKQTAEIAAKNTGLKKVDIIFEPLLEEIDTGVFHGKPVSEYHAYFNDGKPPKNKKEYYSSLLNKFEKRPSGGESLTDLRKRLSRAVKKFEKKYKDKNILLISHEYPVWILETMLLGYSKEKSAKKKANMKDPDYIKTAEVKKLPKGKLPLNENGDIDLHRPYIDELEIKCKNCSKKIKRISDVFDCWFESGSMPYGQAHYPFENKKSFDGNFPAEFIAEGLDQTRGWFYTLLVLSTALFDKPAYKNVVVNGIILAEDGQKMSKRLKNYPDPMEVVEKYGADALRYYLLASPVVRAESLSFSEKGVDEVNKKIIIRTKNVLNFYQMYADGNITTSSKKTSENVLDKWIISELESVKEKIIDAMDFYELDKAVRPIDKFVDDLSTWYLRRSRDRFKKESKDKANAINTTSFILSEFAKLIAPFMPFLAEYLWLGLGNKTSVHLEEYPKVNKKNINISILDNMQLVRNIVSEALQERAKTGVKVRQPLASLKIKSIRLENKFLELIKDEVNVKEIIFDKNIQNELELDFNITEELKEEGMARDFIRSIQEERKKLKLTKINFINISVKKTEFTENFIGKFKEIVKKETISKDIFLSESNLKNSKELKLNGNILEFSVKVV
jgi:isoleucyl-tRNA synthetase